MNLRSLILLVGLPLAAQTVNLPGELAPWMKVAVTARVEGLVERVEVDRGSVVKEDQLLIELSAPEMKARLAEAEARAESLEAQRVEADARRAAAQSTLDRLRQAARTPGAVAGNDVVQAQQSLDAAAALVRALAKSVAAAHAQAMALSELDDYLRITAPFSGVITARYVHPGALASPGSGPLVELQQIERLRLTVAVPEAECAAIVTGARIGFNVPAHPSRTFTGVVARIAHALDPKSRTMPVELDVDNHAGLLAPGMYCEVAWPKKTR
jgi:membrane fusion protein (multidrug efflux system)